MRIVLTGATGFLGRPLVAHLVGLGYECIIQTRDPARAAALDLPPSVRFASMDDLPAADAVIHLAGESPIGYWTPRKRQEILTSRVESTRRLVAAIHSAKTRPHTLLSASAVGFYGHRPGEPLDETASPDPHNRFRAQVCRAWEEAANAADVLGIRVINLRLGNVFDPTGGYLGGLLPIYRHFGGWMLGEPDAGIPWISRDDAVRLITFALAHERWYGPLNLVAPQPLTHREFATRIGAQLGHHRTWRVPSRLTRTILGEFAAALVDDQHVVPGKALASGFNFQHPDFGTWLTEAFPAHRPVEVASPPWFGKTDRVHDLGKLLFIVGLVLVVVGAIIWKTGGLGGLGRLPGDIFIQKGNSTFSFPIVTCILISLVLTLLGWLFRR